MPLSPAAPSDPATATAALAVYRLVGFLSRPFIPLSLVYRAVRRKEKIGRWPERFGRASAPRPPGRVVWVHAASVGETNSVMPLIDRIVAAGICVVFTSVTITAADIAARRLPPGAVHQFAPVDVPRLVSRFLAHWRPECALFVESELWPATIMKLAELNIPQIVVNGRLSQRSFDGWHRFPGISHMLFSRIGLCLAQTAKDGERYAGLGAPAVSVTGNLKFDAPPPAASAAAVAAFKGELAGRPVWVAASTHPGEDEIVAAAHRLLRAGHPGLLTILVPRHSARGADIRASLSGLGFSVAQRSLGEQIGPATDIYLADTMNELGLFYRAAPVAFLGGSLINHGGQNPIEPGQLDTAILHGPHVHNFEEVYEVLDRCGAASTVHDADELASRIAALLDDPEALRRAATAAGRALKPLAGALERTVAALDPYLGNSGAQEGARPALSA